METVLKLLEDSFERLQSLQIQPTLHNVTVMQMSLGEIRAAHQKIKGYMEREVKPDGNKDGAEDGSDEACESKEP